MSVGSDVEGEPKWLKVLLKGLDNEFVLPTQCSMKEYDHVLTELRAHNA
jgi:hypothetical protein